MNPLLPELWCQHSQQLFKLSLRLSEVGLKVTMVQLQLLHQAVKLSKHPKFTFTFY